MMSKLEEELQIILVKSGTEVMEIKNNGEASGVIHVMRLFDLWLMS